MKKSFKNIILFILLLFPAFGIGETLSVVEVELKIEHFGKKAIVFFEDLNRPFSVPEDGNLTFYTYKKDTIKVEIISPGFSSIIIHITPNDYSENNHSKAVSKVTCSVDFQDEFYTGKNINRDSDSDLKPYPSIKAWVLGEIRDRHTGKPVENIKTGIFSPEHFVFKDNIFQVSSSSGGFCFPIFHDTPLLIAVEKEGFKSVLEKIDSTGFVSNYNKENVPVFIQHDIELEISSRSTNPIICFFYKFMEYNLLFCDHVEVFNGNTFHRENTDFRFFYEETPNFNLKTHLGFTHPDFGFQHIAIDPMENSVCFIYEKGYSDTVDYKDLNNDFNYIQPVQLVYSMGWNNVRLMDLMEGNFCLDGKISALESGIPIDNVTIALNRNEWVTYSNPSGRFKLEFLPQNQYLLHLSKNGYENLDTTIILNRDMNLAFSLRKISGWHNSGIEGVIYSKKTDQPLEGIVLAIDGAGISCRTDKEGRFKLSGLAAGEYFMINANTGIGYYITLPEDSTIHREYYLYNDKQLRVKKDNQEVRGLHGTLINLETKKEYGRGINITVEDTDLKTTTNQSGQFTFENLSPGSYRLKIHTNPIVDVDISYDGKTNQLIIPIKKYPQPKHKKEVTLIETGGEVLSREKKAKNMNPRIFGHIYSNDVKVEIIGANIVLVGAAKGAASGLSGDYIIDNVNVGTYKLKATAIGYEEQNLTVDIGSNEWVECVFYLGSKDSRDPNFLFPAKRDNRKVSNWFLEGCLMISFYDGKGSQIIPEYPTLMYYPLDPEKTSEKKVSSFGGISVKNISKTKDPYYLLTFSPDKGTAFSLPFDVELIPDAIKPFLIFKVFVDKKPDGSVQLLNIESSTEYFPLRTELYQEYPWLGQKNVY